jgi:hypothetical protein
MAALYFSSSALAAASFARRPLISAILSFGYFSFGFSPSASLYPPFALSYSFAANALSALSMAALYFSSSSFVFAMSPSILSISAILSFGYFSSGFRPVASV